MRLCSGRGWYTPQYHIAPPSPVLPRWVVTPMSHPVDIWCPWPPSTLLSGGGNSRGISPDGGSLTTSWEIPREFPPPVSKADGGHGHQISTGWDMGVTTHWGSTGDGGAIWYWGVYQPLPEHSRIVHRNSSYHVIVSGSEAESGTAPIQEMLGEVRSGYPGDNSGTCSSAGGGGGQ